MIEIATTSPAKELLHEDLLTWLGTAVAVLLPILPAFLAAAFFALLRLSLQRAVRARVLGEPPDPVLEARLGPLLQRNQTLATSAGVFEVAARGAFVILVYRALAERAELGAWTGVVAVAIAVPLLLFVGDALATAVALRRGDALLRRVLPAFHVLQLPVHGLVRGLEGARNAFLRVAGFARDPTKTQEIVEGLREVIEEADVSGGLDSTEREIIGNVIEFRDASLSAVMTPRTEIFGVEVQEGLAGAAHVFAECGHSRIPVYEGSLDSILGTVSARDVVEAAAEGRLEETSLRSVLRPAFFVPETKTVRELLAELRREPVKLAIVLDEYGGTAGIVTLGDILQELVGEIPDERDAGAKPPVRRLPDGSAEVDASLRVSDVNAELGTDIPEGQDYETLAGFVLSELGRIPKRGEAFQRDGAEFRVTDASDRRVLRVVVRSHAPRRAG